MTSTTAASFDVKERPILFSAPMVRSILTGQKTVTRRVVKPQPTLETDDWVLDAGGTGKWMGSGPSPATGGTRQTWAWASCPYGKPGDRLWVRETWLPDPDADHEAWNNHTDTYVSWSGCGSRIDGVPPALRNPRHCIYREGWDGGGLVWRPSIHMPRWACRILLDVTDVRVERLQDISEEHAIAEGVDVSICQQFLETSPTRHLCKLAALHGFSGLWESINGAGTWDSTHGSGS
jgi:hypothetical protein